MSDTQQSKTDYLEQKVKELTSEINNLKTKYEEKVSNLQNSQDSLYHQCNIYKNQLDRIRCAVVADIVTNEEEFEGTTDDIVIRVIRERNFFKANVTDKCIELQTMLNEKTIDSTVNDEDRDLTIEELKRAIDIKESNILECAKEADLYFERAEKAEEQIKEAHILLNTCSMSGSINQTLISKIRTLITNSETTGKKDNKELKQLLALYSLSDRVLNEFSLVASYLNTNNKHITVSASVTDLIERTRELLTKIEEEYHV